AEERPLGRVVELRLAEPQVAVELEADVLELPGPAQFLDLEVGPLLRGPGDHEVADGVLAVPAPVTQSDDHDGAINSSWRTVLGVLAGWKAARVSGGRSWFTADGSTGGTPVDLVVVVLGVAAVVVPARLQFVHRGEPPALVRRHAERGEVQV